MELVALGQKYGVLLIMDEDPGFRNTGFSRFSKEFGSLVEDITSSLEHAAAVMGGLCACRGVLVEHQRLAGALTSRACLRRYGCWGYQ